MTNKKSKKIINILTTLLLLVGIVLMFLSVYIYHKTFIPIVIPLGIWLITGLISTVLIFNLWNEYFVRTHFILQLLFNMISVGSIFCFLFLSINYYNKSNISKINSFKIIEKSSPITSRKGDGRSSTKLPIITIEHLNNTKELIFNYTEKSNVYYGDSIELTIKKGLLGYEVIDNYKFIINQNKEIINALKPH